MAGQKKTLVLGASPKPERYSYLAIKKLRALKHPVIAIGKRTARVDDVEITTTTDHYPDIDTITLYLNPKNQEVYYDYILSLQPRRIIFNPGTENPELQKMAHSKNIDYLEACTLVLLGTGQY